MKRSGIGNVALMAPLAFLAVLWLSLPALLLCLVFAIPVALIASMRMSYAVPDGDAYYVYVPDYVPDHFHD